MLNAIQISQKHYIYLIDLSIQQLTKKCWPFLYLNSTRALALPALVYEMVITTVCVQRDNLFQ